jgi:hypothetical protein
MRRVPWRSGAALPAQIAHVVVRQNEGHGVEVGGIEGVDAAGAFVVGGDGVVLA